MSEPSKKRVLLVQWAGDYREAYQRLSSDGPEYFHAQRYSVNAAGELAKNHAAYGVMCLTGAVAHQETMQNSVISISAGMDSRNIAWERVYQIIDEFHPTHLIITTPAVPLLNWSLKNIDNVLPLFADTITAPRFSLKSLKSVYKRFQFFFYRRKLGKLLNNEKIRWIGNHNLMACRSLARIGAPTRKIVPWDWPRSESSDDFPPKQIDITKNNRIITFVGAVSEPKGVSDLLEAVAFLRSQNVNLKLRVIGPGELGPYQNLATKLNITDNVQFEGRRPYSEVVEAFRQSDLAVIPSRYEYMEGLPGTLYAAYATRTPVVCTDHPAFKNRVSAGIACQCVPERSPKLLAAAIANLLGDPEKYRTFSLGTGPAWHKLTCPVHREEFIARWLRETPEDDAWLRKYNLDSGFYDS